MHIRTSTCACICIHVLRKFGQQYRDSVMCKCYRLQNAEKFKRIGAQCYDSIMLMASQKPTPCDKYSDDAVPITRWLRTGTCLAYSQYRCTGIQNWRAVMAFVLST